MTPTVRRYSPAAFQRGRLANFDKPERKRREANLAIPRQGANRVRVWEYKPI